MKEGDIGVDASSFLGIGAGHTSSQPTELEF